MGTAAKRARARTGEPGAIELIEEAVHLLRRAPAATLAIYYAGAGAWVLGFLFFWAHTTWFAPTGAQLAWSSLGLTGLFVGLKVAQAEFCARLLAQRQNEAPAAWTWRRAAGQAVAQVRVQAWGVLLVPLAAAITVPFGWVYAFYQNATAIGGGPGLAKEALAQAKRWPAQNHAGLMLLSLAAFAVWVNCATSFYALPWLANRMLGLDNVFGLSGWTMMNTTFLASICALTWLAVDPLVKAFYVLRVFHGRAQESGEDLRGELRLARIRRAGTRAVAAMAIGAALFFAAAGTQARAETAVEAAVNPEELDRALDDVLKRRDFQWQLRPEPRAEVADTDEGAVKRFLREGVEMVREMVRSAKQTWDDFRAWLDDLFGAEEKEAKKAEVRTGGGGASLGTLRILIYGLIALLVIVIVAVVVMMIRGAGRQAMPALVGRAVTLAQPDLRDEATHAAQMPADGWLAMAREQMMKGEWRLALRALYLATLARHAAEGFITLAKFKTNLDYERELKRRAVVWPELAGQFAGQRRVFESVWYGRERADEAMVRVWLEELEGAAVAR